MTSILEALILSEFLVVYIIKIILIGILIYSLYRVKREGIKMVLGFLIVTILINVFGVIDSYRYFLGFQTDFLRITLTSLNFLIISTFIYSSFVSWKKLNKALFFSMIFPIVFIILFVALPVLYFDQNFEVINAVVTFSVNILFFFLMIDLVIKVDKFNGGK